MRQYKGLDVFKYGGGSICFEKMVGGMQGIKESKTDFK
jgi:hypothetical protein